MSDDKSTGIRRRGVLSEISNKNRRQFLRASGLVAAGSLGLSGGPRVAEAGEQDIQVLRDITSQYDSPEAVLEAVQQIAGPLVQELHRKGYLDNSELTVTEVGPVTDVDTPERAGIFGYYRNGEPTAVIQIVRERPRSVLRLLAYPEVNRALAVLEPDEGQAQKLTLSDGVVSTSQCPVCGEQWFDKDCLHNPAEDCECTEESFCGCYDYKAECCYGEDGSLCSCEVIDWRAGHCVTPPGGCCISVPDCTEDC